ncbi:maleate cis-trans isomerase family protein [Actinokineospora diospyrosa]|uniref:Maleate isomerase n=1 Tax=Actinokineospora diospyrosa TaxID=103728 RepID=A0ABT1IPG1_9PSEU|nr:arylmalonate decarboxylase [Actinokineospora diospyrosa]MCP2274383.1 maleate isomerase [Actinokineospora diospyrosa]
MPDTLGYRYKIAVVVPSTNTSAQPELDRLRLPGVTNHIARMVINDDSMVRQPGFDHVMRSIRASTEPAIRGVVTCDPDHVVLAVSPESYWEGPHHHERVLASMRETSGGRPVTMSPDAIRAALASHGDITRVAVITPYLPVGDDSVSRFFTDAGYDVVRVRGLGCPSPARIAHVSEDRLRAAVREVDGPDVQAIVQVGTNVAMARVAAEAEAWLGKPVIANNVVLYWHALRSGGIHDAVPGHGELLANHLTLPQGKVPVLTTS